MFHQLCHFWPCGLSENKLTHMILVCSFGGRGGLLKDPPIVELAVPPPRCVKELLSFRKLRPFLTSLRFVIGSSLSIFHTPSTLATLPVQTLPFPSKCTRLSGKHKGQLPEENLDSGCSESFHCDVSMKFAIVSNVGVRSLRPCESMCE